LNPSALQEIRQKLARGEFQEVEQTLRPQLESGPRHPGALVLLAASLVRQNRAEEALPLIQESLKADPRQVDAWNWLSICLRTLGRYQESADACQRALVLVPNNAGTLFNLGLCFLAANKWDAAIKALNQALAQHPENPQILQNLGLAHQGLGEISEARRFFKKSIRLAPQAEEPRLSLGALLWQKGDAQAALEVAMELLQIAPNSVPGYLLAAKSASVLGDDDFARENLKRAIELDPNNDVAHAMLGYELKAIGEFEEAQQSFERSLQINPRQGTAHWGIVQSRRSTAEDLEQLPTLNAIADDASLGLEERAYAAYCMGKILDESERFQEALGAYDLANQLSATLAFAGKPFDAKKFKERFATLKSIFTPANLRRQDRGQTSDRPIFIVGMIRSGTTLMEQILSSHPQVAGAGELKFWLQNGPPVILPEVGDIDLARAESLSRQYLQLLENLVPGSQRVTDKMPENLEMAGLIHRLMPQAKFVYMDRHPVDNCLSIYTTPYALPPDYAHVRENIALAYRQTQELRAYWLKVLPKETMLKVSYESLVADPEPVIRKILGFLGLPWDDACLRHEDNKRKVSTPSLWQARQPIYQSSSERWRHYEGLLPEFEKLSS
jgi:tetratricopeptide (TPR) repeat protein